jgi:hypothetical protein
LQLRCPLEKDEAKRHFDDLIHVYGAKYPKAAECLINIIYYRQRNFLAKHLNQKQQGGHYED